MVQRGLVLSICVLIYAYPAWAADKMSEQAKRDFMKSCIADKKSDTNYAQHQQESGTTAEGRCEKELQEKLK